MSKFVILKYYHLLQKLKAKLSKIVRNYFLYICSINLIKKDLRDVNLSQFKPYNISSWHHGYMYFEGYLNCNRIFIKVDSKFFLLSNEIRIREIFNKNLDFTKLIMYKKGVYEYLFFEFIKYEILNIDFIKEKGVYIVLSELLGIIQKINREGVLHRDVKLDNFIIIDNKIVLNDYVYSISRKKDGFKEVNLNSQGIKLLKDLNKSDNFLWDDMDSLYNELVKVLKTSDFNDQEVKEFLIILTKIKDQTGRNIYRI